MAFLYDTLIKEFGKRYIAQVEVPNYITNNLKYKIRAYQKEALSRYILFYSEDFDAKPPKPYHLLFNMATGSGKTLVMAALMLYLYEKGYRNFLFFVNSNNIINKTKDNFLNSLSSKYLFSQKIVINGKEVGIKAVENFEEADSENINIKFTTIQQLHTNLNNTKENSITYEDFADKKIVLIADEAHHLSSATKSSKNLFDSWEGTVIMILEQNLDNILLEFTATLDYKSKEIAKKYQNKVIFKYDLSEFRLDGYSKEINLIRSLYDEKERIIQALILNLYRQELAAVYGINLKPVILFKAKRTIKESQQNMTNFRQLIDEFSAKMVENIKNTSTILIVQKAFKFFEENNISLAQIAKRIKANFKEENCISANSDKEAEINQILLNTLEDKNNPIRAVFAVQKLNEGWDVLNLFDIVRLYEGRDAYSGKVGKTTISEAQLIGRGARYFPFIVEEGQDLYTRKFDNDISNDLRVLEELYYHTKEDSRYISELKKALINTGIYEDEERLETKSLKLKPEFKKTNFYKEGKVIFNKKIEKSFFNVNSFCDLGVKKQNFVFILSSGAGTKSDIFETKEKKDNSKNSIQKDIKILDIPNHIIRYALSQNPFFYFENLKKYFPHIKSLSEFILSKNYLSSLEITFKGTIENLKEISNLDYLKALQELLKTIESEIKSNLTWYEGSNYIYKPICEVFKDKEIKVYKDTQRANAQEEIVANKEWYVYNANYGTSEEKRFVEMFAREFEELKQKFKSIYLIRNEREIKIYDKVGRAFEPDFILFCIPKRDDKPIYQLFIEPKGAHLKAHDRWKEEFLKEIKDKKEILTISSSKYLITALPFYNSENENEFRKALKEVLDI